jgi:hypothetical protein
MTLFRRSRIGVEAAARLLPTTLMAFLMGVSPGAAAQAAGTQAEGGRIEARGPAWRFDVQAAPLAVLSGDGLAPVLPHAGFSLAAGGELRSGAWIPARIQLEYFHVFPSAVSSAGDLYRSWAGWDLSLASGARVLSRERGAPLGLDLLGGVSVGAARYPGTTVAFASFSADLTVRADFAKPGNGGWRAVLPLSYIFRPGARSFSAGLGAAYVLPAVRRSGAAAPGGDG